MQTLTPSPSPLTPLREREARGEGSQPLQDEMLVDYNGPKLEAMIMVKRANMVAGVRRTRLQQQAQAIVEGKDVDLDEWIACTALWPDVMACTTGKLRLADGTVVVWPIDWVVFRELPDDFTMPLVDAVYKVNPHWVEKGEPKLTDEKKIVSST